MNINKYRDLCRVVVRESDLPHAQKGVLLRLVDSVNDKEGYTAWPAFDTLAGDAGAGRSTAIRAINNARKLGLIDRIYKGGKTLRGGTSNRYRFNLQPSVRLTPRHDGWDDDLVSIEPRPSVNQASTQCQPDTLSSNDHLIDHLILESAPPSASPTEKICLEGKEGVGERSREEKPEATLARPISSKPRFDMASLHAEMAARGMDMSASKYYRPPAKAPGPPEFDWIEVAFGEAL